VIDQLWNAEVMSMLGMVSDIGYMDPALYFESSVAFKQVIG